MAELIYVQADETLGFGDYTLDAKAKVDGFEFQGDLYKVKTYFEITKLKKNGVLVYESVPGTKVSHFKADEREVIFVVEGKEDTQITLELEPEKEYKIFVDDVQTGKMKTNFGGKLVLSAELAENKETKVRVVKL